MTMGGNGCGPEQVPRIIKSLLFDWFHEASCAKHDEGYNEGGDEARRKVCDDKFYEAMKRDSNRHRGLSRLVRRVQAAIFYGLVRKFGKPAFNYTKDAGKQTDDVEGILDDVHQADIVHDLLDSDPASHNRIK